MTTATAGSCTVIDGNDYQWDKKTHKLYSKNEIGNVPGHYLHFDGSLLKADGDGKNNASFIFHEAQDVDNEDVTIVILEHEESHKVVAINTEDDKVTLEDPPVSLSQLTKRGIDKSHPKILFHKIWRAKGSDEFYFKSLLDGAQRIVGFDEKGKPMNTTGVRPRQLASLFEIR